MKQEHAGQKLTQTAILDSINRKLEAETKKIDRLLDLLLSGHIDNFEFEKRKIEMKKTVAELQLERDGAEERASQWGDQVAEAFNFAARAVTCFER